MKEKCEQAENIGELLSLLPDDPRRIHADRCPRCRALLAAYEEFLRAEVPTDASIDDARPEIDSFIDKLVETEPLVRPGPTRVTSMFEWIRNSARPRTGWAAAAAALIIIVAASTKLFDGDDPENPVLRGSETGHPENTIMLKTPEFPGQGQLRLSWTSHSEADAYDIRLFSTERGEIMYFESIADTTILFPISDLSPTPESAARLLWTVTVKMMGDELFDSAPGTILIP